MTESYVWQLVPFSASANILRGFSQTILEALYQRDRQMIEIWVVLESMKNTDPGYWLGTSRINRIVHFQILK